MGLASALWTYGDTEKFSETSWMAQVGEATPHFLINFSEFRPIGKSMMFAGVSVGQTPQNRRVCVDTEGGWRIMNCEQSYESVDLPCSTVYQ